jgi:hypothetical protein
MFGVHDGRDNRIGHVYSDGNAFGILVWGDHNIVIANNYLAGGDRPQSTGISVRASQGEIELPSSNISMSDNTFGREWTFDYEPGSR